MFESTGRKEMKNKYNKMQGMASKHKFNNPNLPEGHRGSIYGELKLSEKLMESL